VNETTRVDFHLVSMERRDPVAPGQVSDLCVRIDKQCNLSPMVPPPGAGADWSGRVERIHQVFGLHWPYELLPLSWNPRDSNGVGGGLRDSCRTKCEFWWGNGEWDPQRREPRNDLQRTETPELRLHLGATHMRLGAWPLEVGGEAERVFMDALQLWVDAQNNSVEDDIAISGEWSSNQLMANPLTWILDRLESQRGAKADVAPNSDRR